MCCVCHPWGTPGYLQHHTCTSCLQHRPLESCDHSIRCQAARRSLHFLDCECCPISITVAAILSLKAKFQWFSKQFYSQKTYDTAIKKSQRIHRINRTTYLDLSYPKLNLAHKLTIRRCRKQDDILHWHIYASLGLNDLTNVAYAWWIYFI